MAALALDIDARKHPLLYMLSQWDTRGALQTDLNMMAAINVGPKTRPRLNINLCGVQYSALIDSGADISACDVSLFNKSNFDKSQCIEVSGQQHKLFDIQEKPIKILGLFMMEVRGPDGLDIRYPFYVVEGLGRDLCVLGWDIQYAVGMVIDANSGNLSIQHPRGRQQKAGKQICTLSASSEPWEAGVFPKGKSNPHIPAGCTRLIECVVKVKGNIIVKPGTTLLVEQEPGELDTRLFIDHALVTVKKDNQITIKVHNQEFHDIFLTSSGGLDSVTVRTVDDLDIKEATRAHVAGLAQGKDNPVSKPKPPPPSKDKMAFLSESLDFVGTDPEKIQDYKNWVITNHDIFGDDKHDLGLCNVLKHKIEPLNDIPIFQSQFRIPYCHRDFIDEFVDKALGKGIVEPARSPHNSSIFCVSKPGGGLRLVQDLREVNRNSKDDRYSIADVKSCIDRVGQAESKVYSALDLIGAFHQMELEPESRDLTAFTLPHRNKQFRWCRATMGLKGCPASFSRMMGVVFKDLADVITYIDDALIFNKDHKSHMEALDRVAQRIRDNNLKLNPKKTVLGRKEIQYLGFNISEDGVAPSKCKIAAMRDYPMPDTQKRVKEFVGVINYFRSMIKNFSIEAGPLMDLTKKSSAWTRGPLPAKAAQAFVKLKKILCENPIMAYPKQGLPFILSVDAAGGDGKEGGGLGAILTQKQEAGHEKVIGYWSRRLLDHERNYSAFGLEQKALLDALDHFHEYCYGTHVLAYTDHQPLVGASKQHQKTLDRLAQEMNKFDVTVTYRAGSENPADGLSRNAISAASSNLKRVAEAQAKDPLCIEVRNFLEKLQVGPNLKPLVTKLGPRSFIIDDVIWITEKRKGHQPRSMILTPDSMKGEALSNAHGPPTSGHWGINRTTQRLLETQYWPTMAADVAAWCIACQVCQEARRLKARAELTPWPTATSFNQRVHVDLVGPLKSYTPDKYILVATCAFSKWAEVAGMPDKLASTVARTLFTSWFTRYSMPQLVVMDNGGELSNDIMDNLCKALGVQKHHICPIHPQANGEVERLNQDLKAYLTAYTETTLDWVKWLPSFAMASNSAINRSTGKTPYFLAFNMEPRGMGHIEKPSVYYGDNEGKEMAYQLIEARDQVWAQNEEAKRKYKEHYDKRATNRCFEEGDQVLLYFQTPPGENPKLFKSFRPGFIVQSILSNNTLTVIDGRGRTFRTHMNRVRLAEKLPPELQRGATLRYVTSHKDDDRNLLTHDEGLQEAEQLTDEPSSSSSAEREPVQEVDPQFEGGNIPQQPARQSNAFKKIPEGALTRSRAREQGVAVDGHLGALHIRSLTAWPANASTEANMARLLMKEERATLTTSSIQDQLPKRSLLQSQDSSMKRVDYEINFEREIKRSNPQTIITFDELFLQRHAINHREGGEVQAGQPPAQEAREDASDDGHEATGDQPAAAGGRQAASERGEQGFAQEQGHDKGPRGGETFTGPGSNAWREPRANANHALQEEEGDSREQSGYLMLEDSVNEQFFTPGKLDTAHGGFNKVLAPVFGNTSLNFDKEEEELVQPEDPADLEVTKEATLQRTENRGSLRKREDSSNPFNQQNKQGGRPKAARGLPSAGDVLEQMGEQLFPGSHTRSQGKAEQPLALPPRI